MPEQETVGHLSKRKGRRADLKDQEYTNSIRIYLLSLYLCGAEMAHNVHPSRQAQYLY